MRTDNKKNKRIATKVDIKKNSVVSCPALGDDSGVLLKEDGVIKEGISATLEELQRDARGLETINTVLEEWKRNNELEKEASKTSSLKKSADIYDTMLKAADKSGMSFPDWMRTSPEAAELYGKYEQAQAEEAGGQNKESKQAAMSQAEAVYQQMTEKAKAYRKPEDSGDAQAFRRFMDTSEGKKMYAKYASFTA